MGAAAKTVNEYVANIQLKWDELLKKHRLMLVTTFPEEVYGYFIDTSIHQVNGKEFSIQCKKGTVTFKMAYEYSDLFIQLEGEKLLFHYGSLGSDALRLVGTTLQKEPELNDFFFDIMTMIMMVENL